MTNRVLFIRGELRGADGKPSRLEDRVISESPGARGFTAQRSRPGTELDLLEVAVDEGRGAGEARGAIVDPGHPRQQQSKVVAIVAGSRIAGGVDARSSAERRNGNAGIVGDRRQAREFECRTRLDERVGFEGCA